MTVSQVVLNIEMHDYFIYGENCFGEVQDISL